MHCENVKGFSSAYVYSGGKDNDWEKETEGEKKREINRKKRREGKSVFEWYDNNLFLTILWISKWPSSILSLSPSFHRTFSFPLYSFRFPSLHIHLLYSIIFPFSTDRVILNNRTICFETRREHQSIIPHLFRMRRGEWTGCGEGDGREWSEWVVGSDYFGDGLLFILPTITVSNWENTHYCVSTR